MEVVLFLFVFALARTEGDGLNGMRPAVCAAAGLNGRTAVQTDWKAAWRRSDPCLLQAGEGNALNKFIYENYCRKNRRVLHGREARR